MPQRTNVSRRKGIWLSIKENKGEANLSTTDGPEALGWRKERSAAVLHIAGGVRRRPGGSKEDWGADSFYLWNSWTRVNPRGRTWRRTGGRT